LAIGAVGIALVGAAVVMAAHRSAIAAAGVLVAMTPMAWGTLATVNPSALATAGAVAVWAALLLRQPGWLLAGGWAALAMPRRDGLIWACLILAIVVIIEGRDVLRGLRRSRGPLALIVVSTAAMLVWSLTNVQRVAQLGAFAPLAVVAAWAVRALWDRFDGNRVARAALCLGVALAGSLAAAAAVVTRPGGWDGELARDIVGETKRHLTEAIGVLGWLDAPLPRWSVVGWVVLVGALLALAVRRRGWTAIGVASAAFAAAVVTSWVFELQGGSDYGRYWQGRYSLPLLAGAPIALAATARVNRRAGLVVGGAALFLLNVAAWAVARRWAVGIEGTYRPWKWGAELMPVHPAIVLALHAAASAALAATLWLTRPPRR